MYQSQFLEKDYISADRPSLIEKCVNHYVKYLSRLYPQDDKKEIRRFAKELVSKQLKLPQITLTHQKSPGNSETKTIPFPTYVKNIVKNRIISPTGSIYSLPEEKESFIRITIRNKKKERSKFKKQMLKYKEEGNVLQANIANHLQNSAKITNNSFSGLPGSRHNFLYCKANYTAITGFARESIRCGYSHIEWFLGANMLLRSLDDVVNYCENVLETNKGKDIEKVIQKYNLHIPTAEELYEVFFICLKRHVFLIPIEEIKKYISSLSNLERTIIFYTGCFRNLLFYNEHFFRPFFKEMFDKEKVAPYAGDDLAEKLHQDEGLRMMTTSLCYEILGRDKEGKRLNLERALTENEEGYRKFIGIEEHFAKYIDKLTDLIEAFLIPSAGIPKLIDQQGITRTNVIISDTDSAIFSVENIVEWYTGSSVLNEDSFSINAFCVFATVKSLEHKFAKLSAGFGFVGKEIFGISMKNEFFMAAVLRPNLRKTYVSLNMFQEGKVLPKPHLDIKGVQFKSSLIAPESKQKVEDFCLKLFEETLNKGKVKGLDYLNYVKDYEWKIYKSLMSGEKEFLKTESIKPAEEYAGNPISTPFFYADLWNKVFVPEFDVINLPNKCYSLPLRLKGKVLKDPEWLQLLHETHPEIFVKLQKYLQEIEGKRGDITRLVVTPSATEIPEILRSLIDIRSIIYTNCMPLYLILQSMGCAFTYKKNMMLVSDVFRTDDEMFIPF